MKKKHIPILLLLIILLFGSWIFVPAWQKYYIGVKVINQQVLYLEICEYIEKQGTFPDDMKTRSSEMYNGEIIQESFGDADSILLSQKCFGMDIITYGNGRTLLMKNGNTISQLNTAYRSSHK